MKCCQAFFLLPTIVIMDLKGRKEYRYRGRKETALIRATSYLDICDKKSWDFHLKFQLATTKSSRGLGSSLTNLI
jgi:hypothetical protein